MKTLLSVPFAIAVTLLVPRKGPVVLKQSDAGELQQALAQQDKKIEQLKALQQKIQKGEKVDLSKALTPSNSVGQPENLPALREEIIQLQQEYEGLRAHAPRAIEPIEPVSLEKVEGAKTALSNPLVKPDPLRLGRALYKTGKYQEAMAQFSKEKSLLCDWMAAACLEKMGKTEEAIIALKKIADAYPDTPVGKHASQSQSFIETRQKIGLEAELDTFFAELASQALAESGVKK